jgi:hypothetical protein
MKEMSTQPAGPALVCCASWKHRRDFWRPFPQQQVNWILMYPERTAELSGPVTPTSTCLAFFSSENSDLCSHAITRHVQDSKLAHVSNRAPCHKQVLHILNLVTTWSGKRSASYLLLPTYVNLIYKQNCPLETSEVLQRKIYKKFWEELITYFPLIDSDCIENYASYNSTLPRERL